MTSTTVPLSVTLSNSHMNAIVLLLPLLLLVAITPAVAHATNESSYRYGFKQGEVIYHICITDFGDKCLDGTQVCLGHVDNQTACIDGYVNGWDHVCDPIKVKVKDGPPSFACPTTRMIETAQTTL